MDNASELKKIELEESALRDLNVARKWTMFLAIMGFIGVTVAFLFGILILLFLNVFKTSSAVTGIPENLIVIILTGLSIIAFLPVRFMYLFSRHTSNAVRMTDKNELGKAFKNLKRLSVFTGILFITLSLAYIILIAIAGSSVTFLNVLKQ
jgi:hypothetical protein